MKKLMTLIAVFMLMISLVACNMANIPSREVTESTKDTVSKDDATEPTEEESTEPTTEPTEEITEPITEATQSGINDTITFTELVAVDNAECFIKITGIDAENFWGYTLKAQLENKSTDKKYMFSVESAAINGVQCDPLFATEVASGKKANEDISFSEDELEENGIHEYTDIELTFRVYDSDDWTADDVARETVHIYPYGEDKAVPFVRESQENDQILVDNEYVTAIVTGYEYDDIWGYTVNLFLVNKSDKNVMFTVDDVSVNGYMIDPFYADSVNAGNCTFSTMDWSDSDFEENGIAEVEEIEFVFRAYDEDNWIGDDLVNETITLNP